MPNDASLLLHGSLLQSMSIESKTKQSRIVGNLRYNVTKDIGVLFAFKTIGDVASEGAHSHSLHCLSGSKP
jgi:hypothetical protein